MRKKVLITGASRGIGRAIAETFAKEKYDIIVTCKESVNTLKELAVKLNETCGISCTACRCDAGDYEAVKNLFSQIGDVDILINNAGVSYMGLLTDMEYEDWRTVLGTNLDSVFNTCRFAVPGMVRKKKGKIINISSVWGEVGASYEVAYSASKGGVNALTKALAKELAPSRIQVNAIACGVIDTDMNRNDLSKEELKQLCEEIPAGRMGKPSEVAKLVLKLCEAPDYLTGQIITLDGGWI
ncbi:MAG: SDR family NAD(P)-dependent oxidoreductase [Butyrivibrio sp.]|nr:SDR family NAD(P)-dependent oxidoreductase [Butyrivibrio sp.]